MAEKPQLIDAQKEFNTLTLPVSSTPSSHSRPPKSLIFIRFCQVIFAVGSLYSLQSWFYGRFARPHDQLGTPRPYPAEAFSHLHGHKDDILNGQRAEQIYLQVPDEDSAIAASKAYATLPHPAGSDQDLVTAKYVLNHFQTSFNIDSPSSEPIFAAGSIESRNATLNIPFTKEPRAWIDTYYPLMNTPLNHSIDILDESGNVVWTAQLEEDGDPLDEDAANARTAVPVFHGLSKDGDVTGELFYANYGRQEDFDDVERSGVNITGKIALVRYGAILRGLKVKGAEERGAIGTVIYSDPRDDGSVIVENGYAPYPHGPARNPTSVERGSIQYVSSYPGDPTTPGYPAYENSTRTESSNIPHIPSLPVSWSTAKTLLHEISKDGQGRAVRLVNRVHNKITPIWNTMALIPGHIGTEVVVLGCHRDAWVMGAADPSSGTTSVHEVIRGLGTLYQKGWRPLRTILLASWDAEEYGLIGSTEWGEDFHGWIREHVVTYINVDTSVSGSRFGAAASPSLAHTVRRAAQDVPHPTREGSTLWDATTDEGPLNGPADADVVAMASAEKQTTYPNFGVYPLGSGSDFTVFLQRIGIASSDAAFVSTLSDPVYHYHSIYDSQRFQEIYADPGFYRHVAMSKYLGLVVLRLADSITLPLNTTHYTLELESYIDLVEGIAANLDIKVKLKSLRHAVKKLHKASVKLDKEKHDAEEHLRDIIKDWQHHRHLHHHPNPHSHRCGSRWQRISRWIKNVFGAVNGDAYELDGSNKGSDGDIHSPQPDSSSASVSHRPHPHHPPHKLIKAVKRVQAVNKKLSSFETGFISKEGIADREWYKHLAVAPGKWLGYGATTLPALTEALTIERDGSRAKHETKRLKKLVKKLTKTIRV
ncbi:hypothetical protein JB92DRAFT_2938695 [Gautieria morchelliformis]|nr:hypothetical protein JB92DRAFT_2938695 [Gautieria morchelliformis]